MFQQLPLVQDWKAMSIRNWTRRNRVNFKRYTMQRCILSILVILGFKKKYSNIKDGPQNYPYLFAIAPQFLPPRPLFALVATPFSQILQWC